MIVENSVFIQRPVEHVFAYVTNVGNDPQWHTDILDARPTSERPLGPGATFAVKFKPFMGQSDGTMEITSYEPNRRAELRGVMGPMKPKIRYSFASTDGGTRVSRRVELQPPGLMRLVQPILGRMFRKRNAAFMENLKRVLET